MLDRGDNTTQLAAAGFAATQPWQLCLYMAGAAPRVGQALASLRACREQHLAGHYYSLEAIDVQKFPQLSRRDQLLALPLPMRQQPSLRQCLVGNLFTHERRLRGLTIDAAC